MLLYDFHFGSELASQSQTPSTRNAALSAMPIFRPASASTPYVWRKFVSVETPAPPPRRSDSRPAVSGTYTRRPDSRPTLTSTSPFGRLARISASSNSTDQRGSRNIPIRPPPPYPDVRLRLLSNDAALPNAPNSTVP